MITKDPQQLKFPFAIMDKETSSTGYQREIWDQYECDHHVGRLMSQLGFSPQRPIRKAYEHECHPLLRSG